METESSRGWSGWRALNEDERKCLTRLFLRRSIPCPELLTWVGCAYYRPEKEWGDINVKYSHSEGGFMSCLIRLKKEGLKSWIYAGASRRSLFDKDNPKKGEMLAFHRAVRDWGVEL